MTATTSIEWTDRTWNPVRGCSRISPGCENCYAEKIAARFSGRGRPFDGFATVTPRWGWTRKVSLVADALDAPLHWRAPVRCFVNSMSDLFHESLSNEDIAAVFGVMAACPRHTFQVLTKRAERMREWFRWVSISSADGKNTGIGSFVPADNCQIETVRRGVTAGLHKVKGTLLTVPWPLANVWLGVSVEDQQRADERIPHLLATPAAVRFLSCEPLLGDVSVRRWLSFGGGARPQGVNPGCWQCAKRCGGCLPRVDWVIVGGESGPGARPCDVAWIRSIVRQCREASVPVFCKQLGTRPYDSTAAWKMLRQHEPANQKHAIDLAAMKLRDRKGGDMAEWPEDLRVREFPRTGG